MTISESKTDCLRSAIAGPDVIPNGSATRPADLQAKDIEEVEPPLQKAAPLVKEVSKPLVKINVNEAIKTEGIWVKKGAVALIGGHEFQSTACMSPNHSYLAPALRLAQQLPQFNWCYWRLTLGESTCSASMIVRTLPSNTRGHGKLEERHRLSSDQSDTRTS